jgi:putative membrane protein
MEKFFIRTIINGFALYAAVYLVPGIDPQNPNPIAWVWLALIFGVVNALLKPLLKLLTCGLIFLTLGLFTLVINTGMFYVTSWIGSWFGMGLDIKNFLSAFTAALIVSVISYLASMVIKDEIDHKPRRKLENS